MSVTHRQRKTPGKKSKFKAQRGTEQNCYYQTSDNPECHQGIENVNHYHIAGGKVMYFSSVGNTMIVYYRVAYKPPTQLVTFTRICLEN